MPKIVVTNTKSVTHGGSALVGLREVSFDITKIDKEFGSDGGFTVRDAIACRVTGEAVFEDCEAYNLALAHIEANLVVVGRRVGTPATRTFTAKNCKFVGAQINLPTAQDRGVGVYRCPLRLTPGPSDTPGVMILNT